MVELTYPSVGFIRVGKTAINRNEELRIEVQSGPIRDLVEAEIEHEQSSLTGDTISSRKSLSWRGFFNLFRIMRFLVVFWYATTAGYKVEYEKIKGLIVLHPPGN